MYFRVALIKAHFSWLLVFITSCAVLRANLRLDNWFQSRLASSFDLTGSSEFQLSFLSMFREIGGYFCQSDRLNNLCCFGCAKAVFLCEQESSDNILD